MSEPIADVDRQSSAPLRNVSIGHEELTVGKQSSNVLQPDALEANGTMRQLTERQRDVLNIVKDRIRQIGVPPSRTEIARSLGLRGTSAIDAHLNALARKGWIELVPDIERGIRLRSSGELPLIEPTGEIAAGEPLLAENRVVDRIAGTIADQFSPRPHYFLKIRGDSMNKIGLDTGDLVAVRATPEAPNGAIIIARVGNEVTCKQFERIDYRYIELRPMSDNPAHKAKRIDLADEDFHIDGIVVGTVIGRCYPQGGD